MPKHVHEALDNKSDFSNKAVGSGPFKMIEFNPDAAIRFEHNDTHKHANAFKLVCGMRLSARPVRGI